MNYIHDKHRMAVRSKIVSISIFGIFVFVTLAACNITIIETPTAPADLADLAVTATTADSVELTWRQPTDFGTTDGTTVAIFGSYAVKVYQGADEGGSEVEGLTLAPASLDKSTVSVRVSGLSSGTQYAFKLVLSNGNDPPLSSDSSVVSATTEEGVPTAPAGLRDLAVTEASTTMNTVELTWRQPTDFGTTDGTTVAIFGSYAVKVYQGADEGGSEVEGLTLTPSSLDESTVSVKVSGLSSGTQYAFKLVLSNGNDPPLSSDSNVVSATTTEEGVPTAPAGLRDLAVKEESTTEDTVELTWSQPTGFGTTDGTTTAIFGSYAVRVYQGADDSGSEVEGLTLDPASLDESTVSVKVSGLSSDTQYAFKLVLSNGNDPPLSSDSNVVSATTTEEGVPTAPAGLRDLAVKEESTTEDTVELTWSQPTGFGTTDGTTTAIFGSYAVRVYQGADDSGSEVEGLTLDPASLDESTVSVKVSGLSSDTQYAFKLVLSNKNDPPLSSDSNIVTETTTDDSNTGKTWTEVSVNGDWFFGRREHATVVFDNKLWVIGGIVGLRQNDVWSSSDGKSWTEETKVTEETKETEDVTSTRFSERYGHAAAAFNNKLWVIGGLGSTKLNDVWSSSDGKSWTEVTKDVTTPRFSERDNHAAVVFDDKLWVIGGVGATNTSRKNDVWSSSDGKSWTEVAPDALDTTTRFSGREGHAVVVFDGKLWVIGGYDIGKSYKNDVWSSSDGKSWTEVTPDVTTTVPQDVTISQFSGRENHAVVVFEEKLWVIGGTSGIKYYNDVWSSSDGKNWTEVTKSVTTPRFSIRYEHTAAVFDGKIWVIGGSSLGVYKRDVWHSP